MPYIISYPANIAKNAQKKIVPIHSEHFDPKVSILNAFCSVRISHSRMSSHRLNIIPHILEPAVLKVSAFLFHPHASAWPGSSRCTIGTIFCILISLSLLVAPPSFFPLASRLSSPCQSKCPAPGSPSLIYLKADLRLSPLARSSVYHYISIPRPAFQPLFSEYSNILFSLLL